MLSITTVVIIWSILLLFLLSTTEAGCGCDKWCQEHGKKWGKCADGHNCICSNGPRGNLK